ncbi:methionine ABC transporter ATP-binding protein [Streptococcus iniae]|nr:methionine ABC transporter ATP-binding protein [Streptococcus iniae]
MSLLAFDHVCFTSDGKDIIKDVTFAVEKGDFISIVGPSGGGKSTLLKLASHLLSPSQGKILFEGNDIAKSDPIKLRQAISYCFQTPYHFGKVVKDDIAYPFSIRHQAYDDKRVKELFELFQMDLAYLEQDVKKLSGGEKQRIALIRQLLFMPQILLLDEVTSALDAQNKVLVEEVIKTLHEQGITILWITHDETQSRKYANKIITLVSGQLESMEVIK